MTELEKLKQQLYACTKNFDIVGAKKVRDKIVLLEFDQEKENEKATQKLIENGELKRLQILHSEAYLLFSIASSKMSEANEIMDKNHIKLLEISKAYREYEKASDRYYKLLSSAINGSEIKHFFEDYDDLIQQIKIVVRKFFCNPESTTK